MIVKTEGSFAALADQVARLGDPPPGFPRPGPEEGEELDGEAEDVEELVLDVLGQLPRAGVQVVGADVDVPGHGAVSAGVLGDCVTNQRDNSVTICD